VRLGADLPDGFLAHSFSEKRTPLSVGRLRDHVREKLGLPAWEVSGRKVLAHGAHKSKPKRKIAAVYPYVDEPGEVLFEVVRYVPKDFRQRHPDGNGGWVWKLPDGPGRYLLFRLAEVAEAIANGQPVFICEGEKDALNGARLGVVTTCNAGGAKNWKPEHAAHLKGATDIIIVPHQDDAGRERIDLVASSLAAPMPGRAFWRRGNATCKPTPPFQARNSLIFNKKRQNISDAESEWMRGYFPTKIQLYQWLARLRAWKWGKGPAGQSQ
jgi:hypothetical protein